MVGLKSKLYSQPCKIAYLGGSVTAQKNGYRPRLHELICQITQQEHYAINAGIGGVGSLAHTFLLNDFVLKHKPDFCFIECAIADGEGMTPAHQIQNSIESICWQLNQNQIPMCFLQLFKSKNTALYQTVLQKYYTPILEYYDAPKIDLQEHYLNATKVLASEAKDLLLDGIHTNDLGSEVFAQEIAKQWGEIILTKEQHLEIATPKLTESYLYPHLISARSLAQDVHGKFSIKHFKLTIPYLEILKDAALQTTCKLGDVLGILAIADQDSGVIEVKSKQHLHRTQLNDQWCEHPRIQAILLPNTIPPGAPFSIKLSKHSEAHVGANLQPQSWRHLGTSLKIIGLMVNSHTPAKTLKYLW